MTARHASMRGFTLIEVLVAMAVFAVLSAIAYGTLSQIITSANVLSDRMSRIQGIQRTMRLLSQDFLQLAPRPVRDELGDGYDAALRTDFQSNYAVELTRAGWPNPMALPRGTLQRAAYRVEDDGQLVRYHWPVLDRTISNDVLGTSLIDDVENLAFLYLQENGEWTDQWPPTGRGGPGGLRLRPRAVQVILTLIDEGELTRLIEVAP